MGRVFVAGSINMDVVATAPRHPKVGETVLGREMFFFPGGKGANQAVAAARLGAQVSLIGRVGRDGFGAQMKAFLAAQGVDLKNVQDSDSAATGCALIVVAAKDNAIVVVPAANAELTAQDVEGADVTRADVLVSQLEIPTPTVAAFFQRSCTRSADHLQSGARDRRRSIVVRAGRSRHPQRDGARGVHGTAGRGNCCDRHDRRRRKRASQPRRSGRVRHIGRSRRGRHHRQRNPCRRRATSRGRRHDRRRRLFRRRGRGRTCARRERSGRVAVR